MIDASSLLERRVYEAVSQVTDPEIPVLTIADLGVLRSVEEQQGAVVVTITPTYSGCPAMEQIATDIGHAVQAVAPDLKVEIRTVFTPPWSTEMMTDSARAALASYGISPPRPGGSSDPDRMGRATMVQIRANVVCPQCESSNTRLISEFASTACKAMYQCRDCLEPFDHFKEI